ncbi:TetR/AcrR family transcriptional regulator [Fulvivirga sp. M361]|uniref:TetR/AcrR family transcriptional regulator n=1 Tax=Fulvivirga sp. M361 TaxID=2594266 RepID=UPI00117A0B29|nr:TetR/AcrR family transcriptional regulator [Fulvivirga sp. M361]TRX49192.1 TetR/AcrR family transcriptional regulator [Fulvivirga sp. M361]
MEIKRKIVEGASELFHKYGVRSVSMDDIARHLSMSKKTVYQYYKDKDELVTIGMSLHMEKEKEEYQEIESKAHDAIEEMAMLSTCLRRDLRDINHSLLFDLQKYHPKAWQVWLNFKNDFIKNSISDNVKRGMEQGLFRKDVDPEVMAILRVEQVQMAFDDRIFPADKFDFREVQIDFFDHFIHGLVNEKGKKLLDKYLEQENNSKTITTTHEN